MSATRKNKKVWDSGPLRYDASSGCYHRRGNRSVAVACWNAIAANYRDLTGGETIHLMVSTEKVRDAVYSYYLRDDVAGALRAQGAFDDQKNPVMTCPCCDNKLIAEGTDLVVVDGDETGPCWWWIEIEIK
jgi:hypothetical protein